MHPDKVLSGKRMRRSGCLRAALLWDQGTCRQNRHTRPTVAMASVAFMMSMAFSCVAEQGTRTLRLPEFSIGAIPSTTVGHLTQPLTVGTLDH
jgi:hypothetical protein